MIVPVVPIVPGSSNTLELSKKVSVDKNLSFICDTENGNTNSSVSQNKNSNIVKKSNKVKQNSCALYWSFTWNNYNLEEIEEKLVPRFNEICKNYIFQTEIGKENSQKHIQGCLTLKKKMRWSQFNVSKDIHWEKTRNIKAAEAYCEKEDTRDQDGNYKIWRFGFPEKLIIISELRIWQTKIIKLIEDNINDRIIHWIYDPEGNNGKTVFSKYLFAKHDAIIASGGGNKDIACLLAGLKNNGRDLNKKTTFIFNFPRSTEGISWKAIESVKDGLMTSTKYESQTLVFNPPHLFIFSNELPEFNKLSEDRWCIWTIKSSDLIKYEDSKVLKINNIIDFFPTNKQ